MIERDLRVVDDLPEAALRIFLANEPGTILLSGGGTPRRFYERLATITYPWEQAEFFFGDERCVPSDHRDSNYRMAFEALLSHVPAKPYPIDGAGCDADAYERMLRDRFGERPSFDFAVYGLGPDGHTASLFPGRPEVEETERWVVRVPEAGQPPYVPRVTLTVPALSAAKLGVFLVGGKEKRDALRKLMMGEDIPAARLAPQQLVVLADRSAAA